MFLLIRDYALPSIKIRPLTLSALIPLGQKSAVSKVASKLVFLQRLRFY